MRLAYNKISERSSQDKCVKLLTHKVTDHTVHGIHNEPAKGRCRCRCGVGESATDPTLGVHHTKDEETDATWYDSYHLDCEDPSQLVRSKKGERDMAKPVYEEGYHLLCCEPHAFGDMIWHLGVRIAKDYANIRISLLEKVPDPQVAPDFATRCLLYSARLSLRSEAMAQCPGGFHDNIVDNRTGDNLPAVSMLTTNEDPI